MAVTMLELAKMAGVSVATISLVISDNPRISPATKERIRRLMTEMGYVPNSIARGLVNQSLKTVGVIMSLGPRQALRHPYVFEMLSGMEAGLREGGYQMLLQHWDIWNQSPRELISLWEQKRVDGFILQLTDPLRPHLPEWKKRGLPFVLVGDPRDPPDMDWVEADNEEAGTRAWNSVRSLGFSRIGFLGLKGDGIHAQRASGCRLAAASAGKDCPAITVDPDADDAEILRSLPEGLDCLICGSHYLAMSLSRRPFGVVGFDDLPYMDYLSPSLSTVDIDVFQLGHRAADGLVRKLADPGFRIQEKLTLSRFVPRETTRRGTTGTAGPVPSEF